MDVVQDVLIEVNVARDPKRHGVEPARAIALAAEVERLGSVTVRGLMGMAPFLDRPEDARPFFVELRELGETLQPELGRDVHLSMGMTRDFEVAIEEGATMVRVGEAIFGARHPR
jgi:uncharacterized pyridoxal phosphate-containing UPF0001 family protein